MSLSGNEAIESAAERAEHTAGENLPVWGDLPVAADTANLRQGADLNPALLALLPLVGVWQGEGEGNDPDTGEDFPFGEQIIVAHDGGDYLVWQSRTWRLDSEGEPAGADHRESGFWRVAGHDTDEETIELLLAHAEGAIELFYGKAVTQSQWELATDVSIKAASGRPVTGAATRLYGVTPDGGLAYVEERADADGELKPRRAIRLDRVIG